MRHQVRRVASLLPLLGLAAAVLAGQVPTDPDGAEQPPQGSKSAAPVEIRASVSRTAVWVGDRVVYTVDLRCAPTVDILADDLLKERLRVTGGELLSAEPERIEDGERLRYRVRYTLVTFQVGAPAITVDGVSVRYYARGRVGGAAPAGEVTIPALKVAVGSTVPESDAAIALRTPEDVRPSPVRLRLARPVGLALVLIGIVPTAIVGLGLVRRARDLGTALRARRRRTSQRGSFQQISELQPASDAERLDAYGQLDRFVRDHLSFTTGIAAHSLTPAGVRRVLDEQAPHLPSHEIEALLEACERARYAPEPPSPDDWTGALRGAAEVLRTSRR
jgi:hypothetical protein